MVVGRERGSSISVGLIQGYEGSKEYWNWLGGWNRFRERVGGWGSLTELSFTCVKCSG